MNLQLQAKDALDFLRSHPAFAFESGDSLCNGFWFIMAPCCKRGHPDTVDKHGVTVYRSSPDWCKYEDLVDEEDRNNMSPWVSVEVPYERMYGEAWSFDHMEYWYETIFFVFEGNPFKSEETYDATKWGRYGGPEGGANSFEEMLIEAAKEVKSAFGDFNVYDSFTTNEEKRNHKEVDPMLFNSCNTPGCKQIEFNKEYIDIYDSLINHRWVEWYMTTEHAKNWSENHGEWKTFIENGKLLEPQHRKDILAQYK